MVYVPDGALQSPLPFRRTGLSYHTPRLLGELVLEPRQTNVVLPAMGREEGRPKRLKRIWLPGLLTPSGKTSQMGNSR